MTLREAIDLAGAHPFWVLGFFAAIPLLAWILGLLLQRPAGRDKALLVCYAVLIHLACFPGIFALLLGAYALFFTGQDLLDVNLLLYALPVLSMALTLVAIGQRVAFERIPGFDRFWALMVLVGLTFAIVLAISKTRFWIVFGGSLVYLLLLVGVLYVVLQAAAHTLFARRQRDS